MDATNSETLAPIQEEEAAAAAPSVNSNDAAANEQNAEPSEEAEKPANSGNLDSQHKGESHHHKASHRSVYVMPSPLPGYPDSSFKRFREALERGTAAHNDQAYTPSYNWKEQPVHISEKIPYPKAVMFPCDPTGLYCMGNRQVAYPYGVPVRETVKAKKNVYGCC